MEQRHLQVTDKPFSQISIIETERNLTEAIYFKGCAPEDQEIESSLARRRRMDEAREEMNRHVMIQDALDEYIFNIAFEKKYETYNICEVGKRQFIAKRFTFTQTWNSTT